ncbi:MAG TPA: hypothetical protein VG432_06735 [Gemmatimonadaceae bacterium]|nr:hypothetical protein [Gemmatimonadaceae bacterium]
MYKRFVVSLNHLLDLLPAPGIHIGIANFPLFQYAFGYQCI